MENEKRVKVEPTEMLLRNISQRLAGREDCKDVNYIVTIRYHRVHMEPMIYVYPNRYKRCDTDKIDIVSFVHLYKMPDVLLSEFVPGTYQYQSTFDKKKRRWVKLS